MRVKTNENGYVIEIVRYNGSTYEQKWDYGEFEVVDLIKNSVNEIRCGVDEMLWVNGDLGINPEVDTLSEDFREDYETLFYFVIDGQIE